MFSQTGAGAAAVVQLLFLFSLPSPTSPALHRTPASLLHPNLPHCMCPNTPHLLLLFQRLLTESFSLQALHCSPLTRPAPPPPTHPTSYHQLCRRTRDSHANVCPTFSCLYSGAALLSPRLCPLLSHCHLPSPFPRLPSSFASAPASPAPTYAPPTPTPTNLARCSPPQRLQAKVSEAAGCAVAVSFPKDKWGEKEVQAAQEVG
ncbi:unnamed protein product [Closterium sp. Naga37s-1]|nr:unnamed protein product [Closterium sp. Naga37s-1]